MIYGLIGGVVGLILLIVIGKSAGFIGKPKQMEVDFAKTKRATIVEKVSASGTVQPVTEVKIAPEVSGEILELLIEEGDSVTRGAQMVKIRPDTWVSQYERAEASLNQQRSNVISAEAALSRSEATFTRANEADLDLKVVRLLRSLTCFKLCRIEKSQTKIESDIIKRP